MYYVDANSHAGKCYQVWEALEVAFRTILSTHDREVIKNFSDANYDEFMRLIACDVFQEKENE